MAECRPAFPAFAGIFLITLSSMVLEILLTRILSVTVGYHYGFMVISIAMFGMTLGGVRVYQHPETYDTTNAKREMAKGALLFAVTAVASVLAHVLVPFRSQAGLLWIALTYPLLSFPFYFAGVCVCLGVTKFPRELSRFYAADLIGASAGCIAVIYVLKITDAPTAVLLVAAVASLAAVLFASAPTLRRLRQAAFVSSVVFSSIVVLNMTLALSHKSLLRVRWAKGHEETVPLYEKWNTFSRITVRGTPNVPSTLSAEGISSTYPENRVQRQLVLRIDADAETTLTALDEGLPHLDYLRYDVKNIVHYIRSNASVLVIGAGGGRDVLAALLFGQRSARAVEFNPEILRTVNQTFGDFTGHLDRIPNVTFVNDEARSYMARSDERFDIIQASFIDTWAATATGALSMTENALYTVEAWRLFLSRLAPDGVLSFSRWYVPAVPAEAYRLTSLAAATLRESGVLNPRAHILMVRNVRHQAGAQAMGAVTILVSKAPFSSADIEHFEAVSKQMQFEVLLTPRFALTPLFATLANGKDTEQISSMLGLDISAPTDDSPFFFYMSMFRNPLPIFSGDMNLQAYAGAGGTVIGLFVIVVVLTAFWVVIPLLRTARKESLPEVPLHLVFFAAIGFGFMLIEISQMERLIIFLGHPTYALSVVLFALLLSSGLGSYSTRQRDVDGTTGVTRLALLVVILIVFGLTTPYLTSRLASSMTPVRIAVAIGMLSPLGLFMGMAFPLGLKLAMGRVDNLMPALWGVNAGTSICGSILAVIVAMNAGIRCAFWAGICCYAVAFGAYVRLARMGKEVPVALTITGDQVQVQDLSPERMLNQHRV